MKGDDGSLPDTNAVCQRQSHGVAYVSPALPLRSGGEAKEKAYNRLIAGFGVAQIGFEPMTLRV